MDGKINGSRIGERSNVTKTHKNVAVLSWPYLSLRVLVNKRKSKNALNVKYPSFPLARFHVNPSDKPFLIFTE